MKGMAPKGWTKNTNGVLQEIYDEICVKAIELEMIDYVPDLYIFKSTRTWGWARDLSFIPYVGLNEVYLSDPTKAVRTTCHEIAHVANPRAKHNKVWKRAFEKLGKCFGLDRFERCSTAEQVGLEMPVHYKYEAYCPKCNHTWQRQKATRIIQQPERYSCPYCNSKLKSRTL